MSAEHIIEVTPEIDRRVELRRQSDIAMRHKAQKFDQAMEDAALNYSFYRQKFEEESAKAPSHQNRNMLGWDEGLMHMAAQMLRYADRKPPCPCAVCRPITLPENAEVG